MDSFLVYYTGVLAVIILLPLYRVVRGPAVFDRLLGASAIAGKTVVLVCLFGFLYGRVDMFVDIAIAYAVLNFIGIIALAKYFQASQ
jgi:multicomponent Na+:H+ antiporter subunit F